MYQSGQPQHYRMDGQGTQGAGKGNDHGFQAGGPTGPYLVGEVGQRTPQEQPSAPGSPTQQGPLFTPDQLTQIAQIFRMGIEPVVREMSTRLDGLQAQVTRVPEGTAALHGARPVDPFLSWGLSSGPSRFGEQPPTSPGPVFAEQGRAGGISSLRPSSPPRCGSPPGLNQRGDRNQDSDERDGRDIFSKSEKWSKDVVLVMYTFHLPLSIVGSNTDRHHTLRVPHLFKYLPTVVDVINPSTVQAPLTNQTFKNSQLATVVDSIV